MTWKSYSRIWTTSKKHTWLDTLSHRHRHVSCARWVSLSDLSIYFTFPLFTTFTFLHFLLSLLLLPWRHGLKPRALPLRSWIPRTIRTPPQNWGTYLFTISFGSFAVDQRSGHEGISGWFNIFVICKRNSNARFWSTRCEDCFSTEQSVWRRKKKAQKQDRFLRGKQIAHLIYEYFRVTGANDSVENYADLFTISLRNDDIQEFDSNWDGILWPMTKIPFDDILDCKN